MYGTPGYVVFSSLLLFSLSTVQVFSSAILQIFGPINIKHDPTSILSAILQTFGPVNKKRDPKVTTQ
jgi:hypothetical protein